MYAGAILAGGDGTRLRSLTRRLTGDDRPKQFCRALPALSDAFEPLHARMGTPWEDEAARAVYRCLASTDFSKPVLQARPGALAVLPVTGVGWNDLGDPARVAATLARAQWQLASA